jgi:hypothetical protein
VFDDIPDGMLLVGNALFSAEFVMRYLEYKVGKGVFSMGYTLDIIDSNVKHIVLRSGNYIVLEKRGFVVMDV